MRTFEYRLYPTAAQRQQLMACLIESRAIYNEMLAVLRAQYEADGTFPTRYDLTAAFKGRGGETVPATTVQTLADRLSKALKRYLTFKEQGIACGFPRFKTPNRWHSVQLRQYAVSRDVWLDEDGAHLHVPAKLGRLLKIKLHRALVGTPVTAHLVLRADGQWYALIVCETVPQDDRETVHPEQTVCAHPAIGLDVGLKVFLADSAGQTVSNPRHDRRGSRHLAHAQRTLCRRHKGSQRRRNGAATPPALSPASTSRSAASAATSISRPPSTMPSAIAGSVWRI